MQFIITTSATDAFSILCTQRSLRYDDQTSGSAQRTRTRNTSTMRPPLTTKGGKAERVLAALSDQVYIRTIFVFHLFFIQTTYQA